jgi:hypothetical protein
MNMQKKTYFETLTEPSAFLDDWYGWLGNQSGHMCVGVVMSFCIVVVSYIVVGELPYRINVFAACLLGYVAFELLTQGWQGYDTVEDTVFVVGYGAGAPLSAFHEISAGSSEVSLDLLALVVFFVIAAIHLAFGVAFRYNRDDNSKG